MTRLNIDLSELLAPIRQMREEIQKMNEALRSTVQLQAQMAAHQRQAANAYSPTKAGLSLEIQDKVAARGGPTGNVYSINTGSPIPPSNINPTGSPVGSPLGTHLPGGVQIHRSYLAAQSQLSRGGVGIAQAFASQAGFQNDLGAKKEREEAIKSLSSSSNATAKVLLDVSKRIEQERTDASQALKKATEDYSKASESGARDLAKFAKQLDEAAKSFNKVNQKAEQLSTTIDDFIKAGGDGPKGPGGGRGGFGGWWERNQGKVGGVASGLAAATALGFQLAGSYSNIQAMGFQQSLQAMQLIPQNIGAAESLRYQKYMATVAPTTGEQMLEAYGNLLTPGKKTFSYLGVGNRQAREKQAEKIFEEEFKVSEAERKAAVRSSIGSSIGQAALSIGAIIGGVGLTAGTAGLGLLPGLALAGTGVTGLIGAGKDLFTNITGAQTGLAGQKEGGIYDMPGAGLFFNEPEKNAQNVKEMFRTGAIRQREQNERMLIESEKERFQARRLSMGIDENLAAMRMRTAATAMAGGAAVTGFEVFQPMLNKNARILEKEEKQAELAKQLMPSVFDNKNLTMISSARASTKPMLEAEKIAERYAKLGYSIPEVGQIYNTYAGITGTTRGAEKLLGLSRAGVGSVEQMAGNVLGISAVSGKQGDIKQLENIFAKAFEAGLKGAPSIQRFSQAAMEMSTALKLQSATGAAGFLSSLTKAMAGEKGSAQMYLDEARSGLMGLANTTAATSGFMGTLKVLSGAGAGLNMGTGLGLASRSNVIQVQDALQQLSSKELTSDYTKMTGLAREMVGVQISAGVSPAEAIANVRKSLEAQAKTQVAPFAAGLRQRYGRDILSERQEQAKRLIAQSKDKKPAVAAKAKEELKNLMFRFKEETTGMVGLETEGAAQALLLSGVDTGDFKQGQKILASEKAKGAAAAAADFATVNYKTMLNKAALEAAGALKRPEVTKKELLETAKGLKLQGTDEEKIQQLRGAAGLKEGEKFSFAKLTSAMSLLSDQEGVRAQSTIIQDFSDKAVDKLANAVKGIPSKNKWEKPPGVDADSTPITNR